MKLDDLESQGLIERVEPNPGNVCAKATEVKRLRLPARSRSGGGRARQACLDEPPARQGLRIFTIPTDTLIEDLRKKLSLCLSRSLLDSIPQNGFLPSFQDSGQSISLQRYIQ